MRMENDQMLDMINVNIAFFKPFSVDRFLGADIVM